jgi:addiction module RelE/StbE family toxin
MARVVFTPIARQHLRGIRDYIAQDSPTAAKEMVWRIRAEVARLGRFPALGRIVPEYDDHSIRELIVGAYRVVYRYHGEQNLVRVVGVVHSSRLLPPTLDQ